MKFIFQYLKYNKNKKIKIIIINDKNIRYKKS